MPASSVPRLLVGHSCVCTGLRLGPALSNVAIAAGCALAPLSNGHQCSTALHCLQDSTAVDFAYHVHTDVGNQMVGAKVNSKLVAPERPLANAEVVEILTYNGAPTKLTVARHYVSLAPFPLCQTSLCLAPPAPTVPAPTLCFTGQKPAPNLMEIGLSESTPRLLSSTDAFVNLSRSGPSLPSPRPRGTSWHSS